MCSTILSVYIFKFNHYVLQGGSANSETYGNADANECTKVQNPRRHDHELDLSVYNTACANSRTRRRYRNLRVTGSIRKTFCQRRKLKRKKLAALLSSRIPGSV